MSDYSLCVYCGAPATINEHVVPRSRGGRLTLPSCRPCNASKGARTPEEWLIAMWRHNIWDSGSWDSLERVCRYRSSVINWAIVDQVKKTMEIDRFETAVEEAFAVWRCNNSRVVFDDRPEDLNDFCAEVFSTLTVLEQRYAAARIRVGLDR